MVRFVLGNCLKMSDTESFQPTQIRQSLGIHASFSFPRELHLAPRLEYPIPVPSPTKVRL